MSDAQQAYVVIGEVGEYSSRSEWVVAVYLDESKAKAHVELATERARALNQWRDSEDNRWDYSSDENKPVNQYDPDMKLWVYSITTYFIGECPLLSEVPKMSNAIEIRDVGPVESLSIPVPEGGGIVVLRAPNGRGKSHSLAAVAALVAGKGNLPTRDGAIGAQVEGLGARLTVSRRAQRAGVLEVESLDGEDPSLLVDPGIKDPLAADAARLRALLRISRATVDPAAFAELVGGMERLESMCRPASLSERDDVPTMAKRIKADLEAEARKLEGTSKNLFAKADGVRATLDGLANGASPQHTATSEEAREAHTQAVREHSTRKAQREAAIRAKRQIAEAKEALDAMGDDGTDERVQGWVDDVGACDRVVELKQQAMTEAKESLAQAVREADHARAEAARQVKARDQRARLESIMGADADVVDSAEIDRLAAAIESAEAEVAAWTMYDQTKRMRDEAKGLTVRAQKVADEGALLREAAKGTEKIVIDAVQGVCGDGMSLHDGRLCVQTDRGQELFSDLSAGERWRIALDIAVKAVGPHGLLVVRQEAYEGLDPSNRREIAEHARSIGVVILTAEAAGGELRAEVQES